MCNVHPVDYASKLSAQVMAWRARAPGLKYKVSTMAAHAKPIYIPFGIAKGGL